MGVFRVDLRSLRFDDTAVRVGTESLVIKVKEFGRGYLAAPNDERV